MLTFTETCVDICTEKWFCTELTRKSMYKKANFASVLSFDKMECNERVRRAYILAMAMQHVHQVHVDIHDYLQRLERRRRRRQRRRLWQQPWISRRKQFGLYDQLLVELRQEDQTSFKNFMRMPVQMYDEILQRIQHRISKQYTWFR